MAQASTPTWFVADYRFPFNTATEGAVMPISAIIEPKDCSGICNQRHLPFLEAFLRMSSAFWRNVGFSTVVFSDVPKSWPLAVTRISFERSANDAGAGNRTREFVRRHRTNDDL